MIHIHKKSCGRVDKNRRYRALYVLFVMMIFFAMNHAAVAQSGRYVRTVVIDAGHGGKDPGTIGKKSKEKDIALDIALKAGKYIEDNCKDVKVIYTRKKDVFVSLSERAAIANRNKADLFLSIHCNAAKSKTVNGAETFVMGLHRCQANLEVAKKENASILLEEDYRDKYDGFNPNSDEGYITLSLMQNAYLDQSIVMADLLQKRFVLNVGRKDRGVKQAGFLVLYKIAMPGVLIETGFLSNSQDENFLSSAKGKDKMALSIYQAFKSYKNEIEKHNSDFEKVQAQTIVQSPSMQGKQEPVKIPVDDKVGKNKAYYSVQIRSSAKPIVVNAKNFSLHNRVSMYRHKGRYNYALGKFTSLNKAELMKKALLEMGYYEEAFIVAFNNNKRIPVKNAQQILGK